MKLRDTLILSIKNLWRRKLRTILTIMGVMIGCCAIVVMLSLGIAMERNFLIQASQYGDIMLIRVFNWNSGGRTEDGKEIPPLGDKMLAQFEQIKGVKAVTPVINLYVKMMAGKYVGYVGITGIKTEAFKYLDIPIAEGRPLEEGDADHMVVGHYVFQNFYNPKASRYRWEPAPEDFDFMKEKLTISWDMNYGEKPYPGMQQPKVKAKPVNVKAVGKIAQTGSYEYDYNVIMPFETVVKYQKEMEKWNKQNSGGSGGGVIISKAYPIPSTGGNGENKGYDQVIVRAANMDDVPNILETIQDYGYVCDSPIQALEYMKQQTAGLRQILLGIGVMSFIIASIGIANTMYMSIYERTREIGIIKVIGARLRDIRKLFMLEAWWIGVFGGAFGVALSYLFSFLLNKFNINLGNSEIWTPEGIVKLKSSYIPFMLAAGAFVFSPIASLAAGFLPSRRAMRLSVMKAIRQE